jgi:uncharacterized protein
MIQQEDRSAGHSRGRRRRTRLWLWLAIAALIVVGISASFVYRVVQHRRLDERLIAAVKRIDAGAVRALLAHGADANAHDDAGRHLSLWTLLRDRLRGKPASVAQGPSALVIALQWQDNNDDYPPENPALVGALLDYGANPNEQVTSDGGMGANPTPYHAPVVGSLTLLQLAILTGRRDTITLLLSHGADVNARNSNKLTGLMFAAGADEPEMLETLLCKGADVEAQDIHGQTALTYAAIINSSRCIQILLAHHAKLTVRDGQGKTALDLAKIMGNADAVRMLTPHP